MLPHTASSHVAIDVISELAVCKVRLGRTVVRLRGVAAREQKTL